LSIFKRTEVWILLVLTVAGLVFVLLSRESDERQDSPPEPIDAPPPTDTGPAEFEAAGPIEIKSVTVKHEQDIFLAEVNFRYDNQTDATISTLDQAKLVTATGKSTPVFFLAFTGAPPNLRPMMKSDLSLRFSVRGEDLVGELTLAIGDQRATVKSKRSFDPETIGQLQVKTFNTLDW
jgi:hypothetical protein